jgi:hypothetical protein
MGTFLAQTISGTNWFYFPENQDSGGVERISVERYCRGYSLLET